MKQWESFFADVGISLNVSKQLLKQMDCPPL